MDKGSCVTLFVCYFIATLIISSSLLGIQEHIPYVFMESFIAV